MKKWVATIRQSDGRQLKATVEGMSHSEAKRHAEALYGKGNVTNLIEAR